ncbi:hypothetical protein B0G81_7801 [Paraburkholderia sp. BL6665CI2N2]|nr:hypothetical protein B0G81_7801 [Paraburkholderia sp. BL6665CI2N2]
MGKLNSTGELLVGCQSDCEAIIVCLRVPSLLAQLCDLVEIKTKPCLLPSHVTILRCVRRYVRESVTPAKDAKVRSSQVLAQPL